MGLLIHIFLNKSPSEAICSTSFLKFYLCNFGMGYSLEHTGLEFSFGLELIGSVSCIPKVPPEEEKIVVTQLNTSIDLLLNFGIGLP